LIIRYHINVEFIGYMGLRIHIMNDTLWFLSSGECCIVNIERPTNASKNITIITNDFFSDISLIRIAQLSLKVFWDFKNG